MRQLLGLLMVLAGIALGIYVGIWICFIGGIVQIINEVKSPGAIVAINIAIPVAKVFFGGIAGALSGMALVIPGMALIEG